MARSASLGFICTAALACPLLAFGAPAPQLPAPDAAVAAAERLLTVQPAHFAPQQAPGATTAPAPDAERTWMPLAGWVKLPVGAAGAAITPLPDPWPRYRKYQAAWYILKADFGAQLPTELNLRCDAVAHTCEAFVNGIRVGAHIGGYTPFTFSITRAAHPGVNTIALCVRDERSVEVPAQGRAVSMLGVTHAGVLGSAAGLCGGVYFDARPALHEDHILIHTSTRQNRIDVTTWLNAPAPDGATVAQSVFAWPDGATPVLQLPAATVAAGQTSAHAAVGWADARRWSPEHPNLYVLRTTVSANGRSETIETRFGFREFWTEGRNFILNGTPIRLLGTSVAHDTELQLAGSPAAGRTYSRDALLFLKRNLNYRAMRFHASIHPPEAVQGADEAGFLIIDQSSIWSAMGSFYQKGGDEFLKNTRAQFAEWFWRDANNPSVVIFDVENEMIRGSRAPDRLKWVLQLDSFIKDLDPTRITEHSGAAWYAPTQQTIHVHMKEQYNAVLRTWRQLGKAPLLFGEFWVGGQSGENRLTDGYEFARRLDWQQDENDLYRERILEMRNYGASGVLPFWLDDVILGRDHDGLWRSYDPRKDRIYTWRYPTLHNGAAAALAPVIAFAWPRQQSARAGGQLQKEIVVCNDREEPVTLNVACAFGGQRNTWQVRLAPAAQDRHAVSLPVTGSGDLVITLADEAGQPCAGDTLAIHAIAAEPPPAPFSRRRVVAPAPSPAIAAALRELGLTFETAAGIPADAAHTLLIVPPGQGRDTLGRTPEALRRYLAAGGRALVLDQNQAPAWLPLNLAFWSSTSKSEPEFGMIGWADYTRNLFYSPVVPLYASGHPAFAGLTAADFRWWNPTDGRVSDDAYTRPAAVETHTGAAYRVLLGGCRRENASLVEVQIGAGTALLCQAQVLEQRGAPGARALLDNLLRYLDGPAWKSAEAPVGLVGSLTPARLAAQTGIPAARFIRVTADAADAPQLILAGDHANPAKLAALAQAGHTVIVFSREVVSRLPGFAVTSDQAVHYAGTRARSADDPLFWGIATGNFIPIDESPAQGAISQHPAAGVVLLGGLSDASGRRYGKGHAGPLETVDGDGAIAVAQHLGAGTLVATTLEPWNPRMESHRQLLATLLANAGVRIPVEAAGRTDVLAKTTVPLRLDGKLDDWTNDLDDRNVSPFSHAEPIALTSHDVVAGQVESDLGLSGVLYLLHDDRNLYLGGIVFSRGDGATAEFDLAGRAVVVNLDDRTLTIAGRKVPGTRLVLGHAAARDLSDTRLLALTRLDSHVDRVEAATDTEGTTFEAALPWSVLGAPTAPLSLPAHFRLKCGPAALQVPATSLTVRVAR